MVYIGHILDQIIDHITSYLASLTDNKIHLTSRNGCLTTRTLTIISYQTSKLLQIIHTPKSICRAKSSKRVNPEQANSEGTELLQEKSMSISMLIQSDSITLPVTEWWLCCRSIRTQVRQSCQVKHISSWKFLCGPGPNDTMNGKQFIKLMKWYEYPHIINRWLSARLQ